MAKRNIDPIETRINSKFNQLVMCLNGRRDQLIAEYREKQKVRSDRNKRRIQTLQQLIDTKSHIQSEMKDNVLNAMREKMVAEIEDKIKNLEVVETGGEIIFKCDTQQLENTIYEFGQLIEKKAVEIPKFRKQRSGLARNLPAFRRAELIPINCPVSVGSARIISHDYRDKWEVERSALKLGKKLCSGQYSDLWEGVLENNKVRHNNNNNNNKTNNNNNNNNNISYYLVYSRLQLGASSLT